MTQDERKVIELALEALKKARRKILTIEECHAAIMFIKEALAQPEQEPVDYCGIHYLPEPCAQCAKEHEGYNTPPRRTEQEPVAFEAFNAWMHYNLPVGTVIGHSGWWADKIYSRFMKNTTPPQPEKPDQDEVDIRSRLYQRIHELETQLAQPEQKYTVHRNPWTGKATYTCNSCGCDDFRSEHGAYAHKCSNEIKD